MCYNIVCRRTKSGRVNWALTILASVSSSACHNGPAPRELELRPRREDLQSKLLFYNKMYMVYVARSLVRDIASLCGLHARKLRNFLSARGTSTLLSRRARDGDANACFASEK